MKKIGNLFVGRIGRKHWILGFVIVFVGYVIIAFMLGLTLGLFVSDDVLTALVYLAYIPVVIFLWSLHIRRLHDLGHSGWVSLALLVPLVNLALIVLFVVSAGKSDANKYGSKPNGGLLDVLLGKTGSNVVQ